MPATDHSLPEAHRERSERGSTAILRSFDHVYAKGVYRGPIVMTEAILGSWLGIACGLLVFPREASLVSVFFLALYQAPTVRSLLDANRKAIFFQDRAPREANLQLALSLTWIFGGVFLANLVFAGLTPTESLAPWFRTQLVPYQAITVSELNFSSFGPLVEHNASVLAGCFLVALVYRHGGMLLVLSWNAATWGVILAFLIRNAGMASPVDGALQLLAIISAILPHLVLEALAYIGAAMAGAFLSRAIARHGPRSEIFATVGVAVVQILLLSVVVLLVAAFIETELAPRWLAALLRSPIG